MAFPYALLTVSMLAGLADAWGPDGHTIVAHIANHYLTPDVASILATDLDNIDLNNISDWCDDFDHSAGGRWSAPLHFVDYPGHSCKFVWAQDCKNDICNAGAIANYSKKIFDPTESKADRLFALKFVIHMVGDIHQPLHVGSHDNQGGNLIKLPGYQFSVNKTHWSNHPTNLHAVWDSAILVQSIYEIQDNIPPTEGLRSGFPIHYHQWDLLAQQLETLMDGDWSANKIEWQNKMIGATDDATLRSALTDIAQETATAGCQYAYPNVDGKAVANGSMLGREYYVRAKPVVKEQLAKGGVRLAQLLQEALGKSRASAAAPEIVV